MVRLNNTTKIQDPYKKRGYYYAFPCKKCYKQINSAKSRLKRHTGFCRVCLQSKRPFEHLLNTLRQNAKYKNREVSISYEDFIKFTKIKVCVYCNGDISWSKYQTRAEKYSKCYNLDRKESKKGYIKGNCVVCCYECNWLKSNKFSYNEFLLIGAVIKLIKEYRNGKYESVR